MLRAGEIVAEPIFADRIQHVLSQPAEEIVNQLPYFDGLRPEERVSVARRISSVHLQAGERFVLDSPMLLAVASGELSLVREGTDRMTLFSGDSLGETEVLAGKPLQGVLTAVSPATIATFDSTAIESITHDFPVVGLPWVTELARELRWRNDLLREVLLATGANLPPRQLRLLLRHRRARLKRRRQYPLHRILALLARLLVAEPSRRPVFWMFFGLVLALVSARAMVAMILRRGLQEHLFALIETASGHPIHVHHFNYGLLLVTLIGLLAMLPQARRALRVLSFLYGFGLGLVVDEFALLWNLDPNYYQPSSRLAAALAVFVLVQLVYFRSLYLAIGRRLLARLRA